jgi:hypothetical protein
MTETGHRRLKSFARDTGMTENEALTFVFENLSGLLDQAALLHRLRSFKARTAHSSAKPSPPKEAQGD